MKGFSVVENQMGWTAVRVHYSCDEAKNPDSPSGQKWLDDIRRTFTDENQFQQEMELSFWVATGQRVYPEFQESTHCQPLTHRPRKVIYRAWDFGWHTPACVIAQVDGQDRLCVLHEVIGHEQTTRQFAHLVIDRCAQWYPNHTAGFQDFCDPAGQQRRSTAEGNEIRDVEVLNTFGIHPKWAWGWTRKDGRSLIHQLLTQRADGTPGFYVDGSQCPVLLQGFLGKHVYPGRRDGQATDEPDEANHPWADAQACLRYLATGLYSTLGLRRESRHPVMSTPVDFHGYGTKKRPA